MPRVMIVEDQEIIRNNLSQILALSGVDVIEAEDGVDACDKLQACKQKGLNLPLLIISDLSMPRMDGFALLEHVRQDSSYEATPFIFLTAHSDVSDIKRAFELGATDYLIKPFEIEELIAMVSLHLDSAKPDISQSTTSRTEPLTRDSDFFLE
jgi:DNA-binding response OmpR family regulator